MNNPTGPLQRAWPWLGWFMRAARAARAARRRPSPGRFMSAVRDGAAMWVRQVAARARRVRRWVASSARGDRGSFTAELAAGLPALMLLLLVGVTAVTAVTTRLQCVDAAREAALAASRGEPGTEAGRRHAPAGADVSVTVDGDRVTATVRAPVRMLGARLPRLTVDATAVAAVEPGAPEPPG